MKMITISEAEYKKLQEENNSLREFVSQFIGKAGELIKGKSGRSKQVGPKVLEARKVVKMTKAEQVDYFLRKI